MRRLFPRPALAAAAALLGLAAAGAPALAQDTVLIERIAPSSDTRGLFEAEGAATLPHLQPAFGLWLDHARGLRIDDGRSFGSLIAAHAVISLGLFDRLQLTAGLPLLLLQGGPEDVTGQGIGDAALGLKLRVAGDPKGAAQVGAYVGTSVSLGGGDRWLRDDEPGVRTGLLASLGTGPVNWVLNAGVNVGRRAAINGERLGDELTGAFGLEVPLGTEVVRAAAEGVAHVPADGSEDGRLVEGRAGLRFLLEEESMLALAGGIGRGDGAGTPDWRIVVGWVFAPVDRDADDDGLLDAVDQCPDVPEDRDRFRDDDGCPDDDNDGDGIADALDQCPDIAEDLNDWQDTDGCPDAGNDADRDGIADRLDACPQEAEDKDGFEDADGCPDLDDDKDGVPDEQDLCKTQQEDRDGFQDDDGCVDADNDEDGIVDSADVCPMDPEDRDGDDDEDGCPDLADAADRPSSDIVISGDMIHLPRRIEFVQGTARLAPDSQALVDAVAALLRSDRSITRLHVEGHTSGTGDREQQLELSMRRAQTVVLHLIHKGVQPSRLLGTGYGPDMPVAPTSTPEGRVENERIDLVVER